MADKDLAKNLKKMQSSGYFSEDLDIQIGSFSLDHLEDSEEDSEETEKEKSE